MQVAATTPPSEVQTKPTPAVTSNAKGGLSLEDMKKIFGVSTKSEPQSENVTKEKEINDDKVFSFFLFFSFPPFLFFSPFSFFLSKFYLFILLLLLLYLYVK